MADLLFYLFTGFTFNFKLSLSFLFVLYICDALRVLVPFVQFKKPEKHPWSSVTFSKVAGF